jgi:hypothetical protein
MPGPVGALPNWARHLGHAGLLPFVAGAVLAHLVWPEAHPYVVHALAAYAATIVAFLGGVHWGVAFTQAQPRPVLFVWGVVPSLVAWVAVVMPPAAGLVLLGAALLACYAVDRRLYVAHGLERWLPLRWRLSAVAAFCCFLGAAGA